MHGISGRQSRLDQFSLKRLIKPVLEFLYLKWIITQNLPFSQVEYHHFRSFLEYISPEANLLLPNSHNTIQKRAMVLYQHGKKLIRQLLLRAQSDIHITCDVWTSPNHLPFLAILGHFVDERLRHHSILLALKEIHGSHSGENQATIILDVIDFYQFRNKLGYFVMDNITSNDTLIRTVAREINTTDGVSYNPERRRLRCNGHVINLSVRAFLFGKASDDVDYIEWTSIEGVLPTTDDLNKWRKIGPLGKLHNIVVYICHSSQRRQAFQHHSGGLSLRRDNSTR